MSYTVPCPSCGQLHRLTNEHVGISVQCTNCARPFVYDEPIKQEKAKARQIKHEAAEARRRQKEAIRHERRDNGQTLSGRLSRWWESEKETERQRRERAEKRREEVREQRRTEALAKEIAESRMRAKPHERMNSVSEEIVVVIGWLVVVGILLGVAYTTIVMVAGIVLAMFACTIVVLMSIRRARIEHLYLLEGILEELRKAHHSNADDKPQAPPIEDSTSNDRR